MKKLIFALMLAGLTAGPALAQDLPGVYVECPEKSEANCAAADAAFRDEFPTGQTGPYLLIRGDGGGYLAPDDRSTIDFQWEATGDNSYTLRMRDQKKSRSTMVLNGQVLREAKTGRIYYRSISDAEWNPKPMPFKQKQKQDKAREKK